MIKKERRLILQEGQRERVKGRDGDRNKRGKGEKVKERKGEKENG